MARVSRLRTINKTNHIISDRTTQRNVHSVTDNWPTLAILIKILVVIPRYASNIGRIFLTMDTNMQYIN